MHSRVTELNFSLFSLSPQSRRRHVRLHAQRRATARRLSEHLQARQEQRRRQRRGTPPASSFVLAPHPAAGRPGPSPGCSMFSARKRKADKEVPAWKRALDEAEDGGSASAPDADVGRPAPRDSPEPPPRAPPARAPAPAVRKVEADDDDDDDDVDLSAYQLDDDAAAADAAAAGPSAHAASAAGGRVVSRCDSSPECRLSVCACSRATRPAPFAPPACFDRSVSAEQRGGGPRCRHPESVGGVQSRARHVHRVATCFLRGMREHPRHRGDRREDGHSHVFQPAGGAARGCQNGTHVRRPQVGLGGKTAREKQICAGKVHADQSARGKGTMGAWGCRGRGTGTEKAGEG
eukprot:scaffold2306_cov95-Isochrysis_galbana.AAC.1